MSTTFSHSGSSYVPLVDLFIGFLMEDISAEKLAAKIDSVIEVLVDEVDEEGTIARSKADAPEIDGLVYIDGHFDAQPGDFLQVKVIDADHHDLYAEVV